MDLNSNLIAIQGLMLTVEKSTGEFTKIKYKGGNESKITIIVEELKKLLQNKNISNDKKELQNVVMFLVLNTEFKNNKAVDIKEFSHLVNIMPAFSKCLLINVVVELDLMEYYGQVLQLLPLSMSEEMLTESIACLKRKSPDVMLRNIYIIVREVIKKLSGVDLSTFQVRESVTELNDITTTLLLLISRFDPATVSEWKKKQIYEHMGHILLKLFKLMQYCQIENEALTMVIDHLIMTTSCIIRVVTINVFCAWAEATYETESLQLAVSTQAYCVMEKYTKYKKAKELIEMLGPIARKPKSIQETIRQSSPETMIHKINENDSDQRHWFTALLNTKIFSQQEAMDCLDKWHHLCTIEDINRLLNLSTDFKNDKVKKLVLKCASNLSLEELTLTSSRFFWQHGIGNHLQHQSIRDEIVKWMNKRDSNEIDLETIKFLELLLLQNPSEFLHVVFEECMKNGVYVTWLKPAFSTLKTILIIEGLSLKMLGSVMKAQGFTNENCKNCAELIKLLIETKCCDSNDLYYLIREMLGLQVQAGCATGLRCGLIALNELSIEDFSVIARNDLALFLLSVLEKHRCSFVKFSSEDMEITIAAIKAIKKLQVTVENKAEFNQLNQFYVQSSDLGYLETLFSNFSIENYGDAVSKLIKVLSRCVPDEWTLITYDLNVKYNAEKTVEILTDSLLLICQVTNTQNECDNTMAFAALKFYLNCYSICLKGLQVKESSVILESCVIKNVLRILKAIPKQLSFDEGIRFIPLLSTAALKFMKDDRAFIISLIDIHPEISKIIALKIIE